MNAVVKIGSSVMGVINYITSKEMVTLITYKTAGHIRNIESIYSSSYELGKDQRICFQNS